MIDRYRKPTRLVSLDYSTANVYFLTICLQDRQPLLADISPRGNVVLSPAGQMTQDAWLGMGTQFKNVELDAFILMPDHLHGIVSIGVDPKVDARPSLSRCIDWFKTVTTKRYGVGVRNHNWPPYLRHLWQRSFYDHIVRDERDLVRCLEYIATNPSRWLESRLEPSSGM